jgi:hypothetical protein
MPAGALALRFFPGGIYLQLGINDLDSSCLTERDRLTCAAAYNFAGLRRNAPAMPRANFCVECGERLARKGWRVRLRGRFCDSCGRRLGTATVLRPLIVLALTAIAAFAFGRYLRPAPPPLTILRAANSPLSDSPVDPGRTVGPSVTNGTQNQNQSVTNEEGYLCGARTRKGTPCKRRVHAPGQRCFQHKGLPAMVPVEKLVVKPTNSTK